MYCKSCSFITNEKNCHEFSLRIRQWRDKLIITWLNNFFTFLWLLFLHLTLRIFLQVTLSYEERNSLSCLLEFFSSLWMNEFIKKGLWHTSNSPIIILFPNVKLPFERIFYFFLNINKTIFPFMKIRWNSNLLFKTHNSADWACNLPFYMHVV